MQEVAVKLLMPARTPDHAAAIWAVWKPYSFPPPGHLLAGENAIRGVVISALIPAYKTKTAGMNSAKVLLDAIGDAIHVESFRQFTVEDLEEEIAVSPPPILTGANKSLPVPA